MVEPVKIDPDAMYDDIAIGLMFGITPTALSRARRDKTLKFKQVGKRILYLGQWVIDWLGHADDSPGNASREVATMTA